MKNMIFCTLAAAIFLTVTSASASLRGEYERRERAESCGRKISGKVLAYQNILANLGSKVVRGPTDKYPGYKVGFRDCFYATNVMVKLADGRICSIHLESDPATGLANDQSSFANCK